MKQEENLLFQNLAHPIKVSTRVSLKTTTTELPRLQPPQVKMTYKYATSELQKASLSK